MIDPDLPRLLTVSAWVNHHEWPSKAALRHYIRRANSNGLSEAIHRVGRRVLIDEAAFFSWVYRGGSHGAR